MDQILLKYVTLENGLLTVSRLGISNYMIRSRFVETKRLQILGTSLAKLHLVNRSDT